MADALQDARTNESWRHDYMSIEMLKIDCRNEGRVEGRKEGREENKKENALAMLKDKMAEALVAKYSGLSPEEVHALAATL